MAFLAKQFTSLLLLLIISSLILSTHAVRQHFNQFGRMTTTTATTTTDQKPDNYVEFSQPAFYENNGERNGLGTSPPPPSFRPTNYDPEMYTTSQETQKNMYENVQENDDPSVEKNYRAYNPFSNSKYDVQYNANKKPTTTDSKKQTTEKQDDFYYKDTSSINVHNNQQTQSSKPLSSSSSNFNQQYNQNNLDSEFPQEEGGPFKAKNYDPFSSTKFDQQSNQNKDQKYPTTVPVNEFYQQDPTKAAKYNPYDSKKSSTQFIEAEEDKEEKKKKPTAVTENQFGNKYNPFQQAYNPTESKKYSNSKSNEQYTTVAEKYAGEDEALDAFLNDQEDTPSYKSSKNSVQAQSYDNTKHKKNWETWQAYDQKQDNKYDGPESYSNTKKDTNNYWKTWEAYGQKQDNKYADSETYENTKKGTNGEWPSYHQKQQEKDNDNFAMTDAELNAILDAEEKQDEDEIESPPSGAESPPQGISDTRLPSNQQYYQSTYKWQEHAKDFANAFSGDALSQALNNNP